MGNELGDGSRLGSGIRNGEVLQVGVVPEEDGEADEEETEPDEELAGEEARRCVHGFGTSGRGWRRDGDGRVAWMSEHLIATGC